MFAYETRVTADNTIKSLEWCLNSPPKPHAFASLPVQSASDIGTAYTQITTVYFALELKDTDICIYKIKEKKKVKE